MVLAASWPSGIDSEAGVLKLGKFGPDRPEIQLNN